MNEPTRSQRRRERRKLARARLADQAQVEAAATPPPPVPRPPLPAVPSPPVTRRDKVLGDLVGAGPSQLGGAKAARARDMNRPSADDLENAERDVVIVRRNWTPPPNPAP